MYNKYGVWSNKNINFQDPKLTKQQQENVCKDSGSCPSNSNDKYAHVQFFRHIYRLFYALRMGKILERRVPRLQRFTCKMSAFYGQELPSATRDTHFNVSRYTGLRRGGRAIIVVAACRISITTTDCPYPNSNNRQATAVAICTWRLLLFWAHSMSQWQGYRIIPYTHTYECLFSLASEGHNNWRLHLSVTHNNKAHKHILGAVCVNRCVDCLININMTAWHLLNSNVSIFSCARPFSP